MRKILWLALCLWLCVVGIATTAMADSASWVLTGTNDAGSLPCSAGAPCASVMISTSGDVATFTVSSLLSGWVFDTFGFNSSVAVSLVAGSGTGELGSYSLGGSGNEDGWGSFGNNFHTGKAGGSSGGDCVVTAGSPGPGCTFSFKVMASSALTVANFEILSSGGNGSGYFAGHMASASKSGYSGKPSPVTPPISEPGALLLLLPGLLYGGGALRQRFFQA